MNPRSHKFRRPNSHHYVKRHDLSLKLDHAAALPLTAVLAPPGYGKTTFISNYLQSKTENIIWYNVDDGDTDLSNFFHYLALAVKNATPQRRRQIPHFQPINFPNIKAFARDYFVSIFSRLDQPFYLVFDDIHECTSPLWAEVIHIAIDELPSMCRIFLIGRHALPTEFSRLKINQKIHFIEESDLKFDDQELVKLARSHHAEKISDEQIQRLQEMMAGWAAGLTLLLSRSQLPSEHKLLTLDTEQDFFEYFSNEILKHIDEQTRNVLFRTCYLPDISQDHAVALSNDPNAGLILQQLYQSNYFTYRASDTEVVYRYHPLFKVFLQNQCKKELTTNVANNIQQQTASTLEKSNSIVAAANLLIELNEWRQLAGFIIKYAKNLVATDRISVLCKWLQALPKEMQEKNPWLLYWRGFSVLFRDPALARKDCINAYQMFLATSDLAGQCVTIAGIIESYTFQHDTLKPLDEWVEKVDLIRCQIDEQAPKPIQDLIALNMFAAVLHRTPSHPYYQFWLQRVIDIPMNELPYSLQIKKQLLLTLHYLWFGDFRQAAIYHSQFAQKSAQRAEIAPRIIWHLIHAFYLWCVDGDSQQALKMAKQGLELSAEYKISLWNIPLLLHASAAAVIAKDSETESLLNNLTEQLDSSRRLHLSLYHMLQTIHNHRKNDFEAAMYHINQAKYFAETTGAPFYLTAAISLEAQLWFYQKDYHKARQCTEQSYRIAVSIKSNIKQLHHLLLSAMLEKAQDRADLALETTRQALILAKNFNLLPGLWVCDSALAEVLIDAIHHGIEKDYAYSILKRRHLAPPTLSYEVESWPWPIRIYTLDRFEILINGEKLKTTGRNRPKVISLLKTLIAFGGTQVREELISETVWPDADGDAAHQLFTTTVFRLRKFLGQHNAVINRDGRLSLNEQICWLDVWALDLGIDRVNKLLNETDPDQEHILEQYHRLKGYYQSDTLLSETDIPLGSASHPQQHLRTKWVRLLFRLANYWTELDDINEEISCYETIISVNPLEEKAYRKLIERRTALGQRSEAASVFEKCKLALKHGLNVMPSQETKSIAEKIFTNENQ